MYTVYMEQECGCFKKSEYENAKEFNTQHEAYNYANLVTEFMNEDFCQTHAFMAYKTEDNNFVIGVSANPNTGSCGTDKGAALTESSSCSSGSCGC
jgi:hypothetical protein